MNMNIKMKIKTRMKAISASRSMRNKRIQDRILAVLAPFGISYDDVMALIKRHPLLRNPMLDPWVLSLDDLKFLIERNNDKAVAR